MDGDLCPVLCLPIVIISVIVLYISVQIIKWLFAQFKWSYWRNTPKDLVIVHGFPPCKVSPNPSPFTLKLLTFLRMYEIPYEVDFSVPFILGPKQRAPWISYNGKHMGDSELIIDFLKKELSKTTDEEFTPEQIALSTAVRIILEEHAFWGMALERFVHGGKNFHKVMSKGIIIDTLIRLYGAFETKRRMNDQGLGVHTREEQNHLISKNLRAVSTLLGDKPFILGDKPCVNDCAIFGQLFSFVWALPNSPYEKLINDELQNLKEYCFRMRDRFFPDWNEMIEK